MSIKPGSKYYPLFLFFEESSLEEITLTLNKIEEVLGAALPKSARSKRAWWSNRESTTALQAGAWTYASYRVTTIDLANEKVTFQHFQASYTVQTEGDKPLWKQGTIKALRKQMGLTQAEFAKELGVRRQTVSEWENGVYDPDRSTTKHLELVAKLHNFQTKTESDNSN